MVVFPRLPSRLASRTHFGAYAEGSSRFPFPSTGLLMDASHTHRLSNGRLWQAVRPAGATGSSDERSVLLVFGFVRRARRGRQLEHRRVLAFVQPGEQHGLPVGELQRIVMLVRLAHVDLPEQGYFLPEFHVREKSKKAVVPDFHFERDLRAG